MSNEPKEPAVEAGRRPHRDRVKTILDKMAAAPVGFTAAVMIDNTQEMRDYYLHHLETCPFLKIAFQGALSKSVYTIKVERIEQGERN